jgi:hypothetical protein
VPSLTIFTTPKPFVGDTAVQQRNAIRSWQALGESVSVLLLGDDGGAAEVADELGIDLIADVDRGKYPFPLIRSLFGTAHRSSRSDLLCYVNADIILMPDFLRAIESIPYRAFLVLGQRWDLDLREPIQFGDPMWTTDLRARVRRHGKLHGVTGMDYFAYPHGLVESLPSFVVGRVMWDNWLVFHARTRGIPVIDITSDVVVVHQNHHHLAAPGGDVWEGPDVQNNKSLAEEMLYPFTISDATHHLVGNRVVGARSPQQWLRFLEGQIAVGLRRHARSRRLVRMIGRLVVKAAQRR